MNTGHFKYGTKKIPRQTSSIMVLTPNNVGSLGVSYNDIIESVRNGVLPVIYNIIGDEQFVNTLIQAEVLLGSYRTIWSHDGSFIYGADDPEAPLVYYD